MGHITKGGVELPVFQCARETTSLESFHLHLAWYTCKFMKFCYIILFDKICIDSSASEVHYQGLLVEPGTGTGISPAARLSATDFQPAAGLQGQLT